MGFQVEVVFSVLVDDEDVKNKEQAIERARDWIAESQENCNPSEQCWTPEELKEQEAVWAAERQAKPLLLMLKAANHALYVAGSPKAMKAALSGSKELIRLAEGR
jgi:hypothetical protein